MSARKINPKKAAAETAGETAELTAAATTEITESGGREIADAGDAGDLDPATGADGEDLADIADVAESDVDDDADALADAEEGAAVAAVRRGVDWPRVFAVVVLPVLALLLGAAAA